MRRLRTSSMSQRSIQRMQQLSASLDLCSEGSTAAAALDGFVTPAPPAPPWHSPSSSSQQPLDEDSPPLTGTGRQPLWRSSTATSPLRPASAGKQRPPHAYVTPSRERAAQHRLASRIQAGNGSAERSRLLEAGAHLFLAEELRAAVSRLSDEATDPSAAGTRLLELSNALRAQAGEHHSEYHSEDAVAVGGSSVAASASMEAGRRAASLTHRATQLRHAATAVLDFARIAREQSSKGGRLTGSFAACHPNIIPTLLQLADNESALARSCARPGVSLDRAHEADFAALSNGSSYRYGYAAAMATSSEEEAESAGVGASGSSFKVRPVVRAALLHARRRLAAANAELARGAKLPGEVPSLLSPAPAPDAALVAARVLANAGNEPDTDAHWKRRRSPHTHELAANQVNLTSEMGEAHDSAMTPRPSQNGSPRPSQIRSVLLNKWRLNDNHYPEGSSDDEEAEEERAAEERSHRARRALKTAVRLCKQHHYVRGVCVRCLEREVDMQETPERGHTPWRCPDGLSKYQRW